MDLEASSRTVQYCFTGRVLPERTAVTTAGPLSLEVDIPGLSWIGKATISVVAAQISVVLTGSEVHDLATLKNAALGLSQSLLDALGYRYGRSYTSEITALHTPAGGHIVFGVQLEAIEATTDLRPSTDARVIELSFKHPQLCVALADLREAIRQPRSTAFHCMRAVEAIRQHFKEPEDRGDGESWERLRESLRLSRATTSSFGRYGGDQRHGAMTDMSGSERVACMTDAWAVVDRFVLYLDAGGQTLDEGVHALL